MSLRRHQASCCLSVCLSNSHAALLAVTTSPKCPQVVLVEAKASNSSSLARKASDTVAIYATPPDTPPAHGSSVNFPKRPFLTASPMSGMEREEARRRQYGPSNFPTGYAPDAHARSENTMPVPNVGRGDSLESIDRFRQAQMTASRPPPLAAMSVDANTQDLSGFGQYPASQDYTLPQIQGPGASFQYQTGYAQEHPRQSSYQQPYTSQLVYGVPQHQMTGPSQYSPVQQYQSRQPVTAPDLMPAQYGGSQYYNPGVGGSTSISAMGPPQYSTASYQQPLQYSPPTDLERSTLVSPYPGMGPDAAQTATTELMEAEETQPDPNDVLYTQYRKGLRETNENASRGRLVEAGESLLEISGWLLENAEGLELTKDNQAIHQDRLKLWKDFNYCWLAFLTRQLTDTKRLQALGQRPAPGQSVLSKTSIKRLGDELTRLCDGLDKSGLVDYEMGVWEEEIIGLLLQCREAASTSEDDATTPKASQRSRQG